MMRAWTALLAAFSYFSILPVRGTARVAAPDPQALLALPFVGLVLGALAGFAAYAVSFVAPEPLVVATAFALSIILTGAIHLDGFLDCSDAIFASVTPARRLEILKDPTHGSYAIAAMAVVTVVWLAALASCPPHALPAVLAFAASLARLAAVWSARWCAYVPGRQANPAIAAPPSFIVACMETLALAAFAWFFAPHVWIVIPAVLLATFVSSRMIASRLGGGLVGDAYGFIIVTMEPLVIAVMGTVALSGRG